MADLSHKIPDINEIGIFLSETSPPFDLSTGLIYRQLSNQNKKNKGSNKGLIVNVFDNGKLLEGSPFSSYTQAALAMGNINISSIITKKINTGRLYKNRYKFESVTE